MTLTSFRVDDLGDGLDWHTLSVFLSGLPLSSAYQRAKNPELTVWANGQITALVLADIVDTLNEFRREFAISRSERNRSIKLKRYPRPLSIEKENNGAEHFGADPIPISEFDDWWCS